MRVGRDGRKIAAWSGSLLLAALVGLISAGGAGAAAGDVEGLHESGRFYTGTPAQTLSIGAAERYWTPERLANAAPLELASDGSARIESRQPELFATAPETFKSVTISNPARYPNRVHGKIFGTFAGLGDYSCSGTVVSSGSGSLLTTAGHCAFDLASGTVASNLIFLPGYEALSAPYGFWPIGNLILNKPWVKRGSLDYDFSMMRTVLSPFGPLQGIIGSRGIGFNQPRRQRLQAYGYPAKGAPAYDGTKLIRCDSGYVPDPASNGGPRSRGMHCDQQQGSSGGGWVAQHSFVVSNTSHGYPQLSNSVFFGPYYGAVAKAMYKANTATWPSVGPIRCDGEVATIIGTNANDRIRGGGRRDIIATLNGKDTVKGGDGKDVICAGIGNDKVIGGDGDDKIDGGQGRDKCGKRKGGNKLNACEGGGGKK